MRLRIGNPHREAHGKTMRCLDWIAPQGTDPHQAMLAMEGAIPGVKLYHRNDGEVHGFVNTSLRPDGSVYVCVSLYDVECTNVTTCIGGHRGVSLRIAPAITEAQQAALKQVVGEHGKHKLIGNPNADKNTLRRLGFTDQDSPLQET